MLASLLIAGIGQQNPSGLALAKTAHVVDKANLSRPGQVDLGGLLGERYRASEFHRLLVVDEDELLGGYRHRPGKHPWIGEHVGKWLHAASLTYAADRNEELGKKLRRVAKGLMACQEADGYLGTYPVGKRFSLQADSEWDVWSHKYCLLGLLSYYQTTGDRDALRTCEKIGNLLLDVFRPGGKLLSQAGTHEGMAATSVLEPIILLYRATGEGRYLEFGKRIVESWKEPGGSHLEADLLRTGSVAESSNGKAYEMTSNLVGLTELYRATGDRRYIRPVAIAWRDIVAKRLYPTGTGSAFEHWTQDGVMPFEESDNVGETCVTVTWMQLNLELYRLTGESRYMDEFERSAYNHLLAAQRPDGAAWCYYTPLKGVRHPGSETTCCLSSGPRGVALIPLAAYSESGGGVDVNLYGPSKYRGKLVLRQIGDYPSQSAVRLTVDRATLDRQTLRLRVPGWCGAAGFHLKLNGRAVYRAPQDGYLGIRRRWRVGDRLDIRFEMPLRELKGAGSEKGLHAYAKGPIVYAVDYRASGLISGNDSVGSTEIPRVEGDGFTLRGFSKGDGYPAVGGHEERREVLKLLPFYTAGQREGGYSVWLQDRPSGFGLPGGPERMQFVSRHGNVSDSIIDGDPLTLANTYTGTRAAEDWYSVLFAQATEATSVTFRHGRCYHDGGWFDTSLGKPRVEVLLSKDGKWQAVGTLDSYPTTNAKTQPLIHDGQSFTLKLPLQRVFGVRIVGIPSEGDRSEQNFSSCSELGVR